MIELAKHIEVLLLENDCVIVPGLGGFIAHNRQAEFKESENLFSSPARTIGFNPQLVMNDGLLVQTYMQAYNTDFPDATRKIEKIVSSLKEQLYQKGEVMLPNVGTLYYTMNGTYVFEPSADTFFTPYLYGLDGLKLTPLQAMAAAEERVTIHTFVRPRQPETRKDTYAPQMPAAYKRTFQRMAQNAVGIAAAILLFFLLSVPVENTYMDDASYASLSAESMFDAIRGRSAATQLLGVSDSDQDKTHRTKSNVNTLRPVSVKSETVAPVPAKPEPKKLSTKVAEMKEATADVEKATKNKSMKANAGANVASTEKAKPITSPQATTAKAKTATTTNANSAKAKAENTTTAHKTAPSVNVASSKQFYLIVASLATTADAQKQLKFFQDKGFNDACIIESGNRHRIALYHYSQSADAYKKLKELRAQEDYKSAWVFASK